MQTIRITTSQNIDIDYEVAGLGERILARLIDLGIFLVLYIASTISGVFLIKTRVLGTGIPLLMMLCLVLFVFYDIICEAFFNGQSVGKRVMKIRVISLDGGQPSLGQYLMRWIFRIVDFIVTLQIGALLSVILTENKQRIGDLVAGTTLVHTKPRTDFNHIAFAPVSDDYTPIFPEASQLKNSEIVLIHEVINNFAKSDNFPLLYNTATKFKQHLNISSPTGMDDLSFLQSLIRDYNHAVVQQEA